MRIGRELVCTHRGSSCTYVRRVLQLSSAPSHLARFALLVSNSALQVSGWGLQVISSALHVGTEVSQVTS